MFRCDGSNQYTKLLHLHTVPGPDPMLLSEMFTTLSDSVAMVTLPMKFTEAGEEIYLTDTHVTTIELR